MKPDRLRKGDTIGIVSPARWMDEEELRKTSAVFEQMGFQVRIAPQNLLRQNQFSGSANEQARAVEEMFSEPQIRAIVCARGGYGTLRIVDLLDYDLIAGNPKIFMGYSDITALLISIWQKTGLVTFHGPMLHSFTDKADPFTLRYLRHSLSDPLPYQVAFDSASRVRTLRPGMAEGELFGGNLSILVNLIGTPNDFDTRGMILFIEDVDEYYYSLERMLLHLKRSGKFDEIAGLIVGEMVNMKDNEVLFGKDVAGIVMDVLGDSHFPVIMNFPCGHGNEQLTIPISVKARLECSREGSHFSLLESPVH